MISAAEKEPTKLANSVEKNLIVSRKRVFLLFDCIVLLDHEMHLK